MVSFNLSIISHYIVKQEGRREDTLNSKMIVKNQFYSNIIKVTFHGSVDLFDRLCDYSKELMVYIFNCSTILSLC